MVTNVPYPTISYPLYFEKLPRSLLKELSRGCSGCVSKNLRTFLIPSGFTFLKRVFNSSPMLITVLIDGFAKVVPINDKLLIEKISRKETEWLIFLLIISNIPLNLQLCVQKGRILHLMESMDYKKNEEAEFIVNMSLNLDFPLTIITWNPRLYLVRKSVM